MAWARCPSCLLSMDDHLQHCGNYITPYTFKHIQDLAKISEMVKVKERLSDNTFVVIKYDQTHVIASPVLCQCNYPGLLCHHIFKVRQLLRTSCFTNHLFWTDGRMLMVTMVLQRNLITWKVITQMLPISMYKMRYLRKRSCQKPRNTRKF